MLRHQPVVGSPRAGARELFGDGERRWSGIGRRRTALEQDGSQLSRRERQHARQRGRAPDRIGRRSNDGRFDRGRDRKLGRVSGNVCRCRRWTTPDAGVATSGPITPPVSDTKSTIPVAHLGGYTTEANIIYGPLPEQRLDVLYPPTAGPKGTQKLPGVIMFHGGGWIQGDKATMSSFYSRFLAHGFIVCTVEYRVADQAIAPAAVQDSLLAAKWFWDHMDYYHIDKTKYVVTGASAGGHLALMVGMADHRCQLGSVESDQLPDRRDRQRLWPLRR